MAKFGAILAQGIIDASVDDALGQVWRNPGPGHHRRWRQERDRLSAVQNWPHEHAGGCGDAGVHPVLVLVPSLSLPFARLPAHRHHRPQQQLGQPVAQFKSSAKPSTYGYTPNIEEKKKEDKEKVATAVLSITAKQKKKNAEKGKKDGEEKMDVDTEKKEDKKEKMEVDEDKKEVEEKKKEPEPNFGMLSNPARVT